MDTTSEVDPADTLVRVFVRSVEAHASRPAVLVEGPVAEDGDDEVSPAAVVSYTYGDLNQASMACAAALGVGFGCTDGPTVGLWLHPTPQRYALLLGILRAGGAYLPFDRGHHPAARVAQGLEDAGAALLVVAEAEELSGAAMGMEAEWPCAAKMLRDVVVSGAAPPAASGSLPSPGPRSRAYVIFTSGSTGRPKGVGLSHGNACAFVSGARRSYLDRLGPSDRVLQAFSLAFDASVEELWAAWSAGGSLVMAPEGMARETDRLAARLRALEVSVWSTVPTVLGMVASMGDADLPHLKLLIVGGEACSPSVAAVWAPAGGARRMANTYGPTEATVVATMAFIQADRPVTIGRALPGYLAKVVDPETLVAFSESDVGKEGELWIGGPGVAEEGYLNRPEVNAQKFIADEATGARWYRSGDAVAWSSDAVPELLYKGRIDTQLKIRGFRVEIEEIEAHAERLCSAQLCVVAPIHGDGPVPAVIGLRAYVVVEDDAEAERVRGSMPEALKGLKEFLPEYMVPSAFVALPADEVPRLPSGKVNRRALPAAETLEDLGQLLSSSGGDETEADDWDGTWKSVDEQKLAEILSEALGEGAKRVTPNTSFASVGNSVVAARVVNTCREVPHGSALKKLNVKDLYAHGTVRELVRQLTKRKERLDAKKKAKDMNGERPEHVSVSLSGRPDGRKYTRSEVRVRLMKDREQRFVQVACLQALLCILISSMGGLLFYVAYVAFYMLDYPIEVIVAVSAVMFWPVSTALTLILAVWFKLLLGPLRPGNYKVWSYGYLRWWCHHVIEGIAAGVAAPMLQTPFACAAARLMGARIGCGVFLGSFPANGELVTIGDGVSIGQNVELRTHYFEKGYLMLRRVKIGDGALISDHCWIGGACKIGAGAVIYPHSAVPHGEKVPAGSGRMGSPAVDPNDLAPASRQPKFDETIEELAGGTPKGAQMGHSASNMGYLGAFRVMLVYAAYQVVIFAVFTAPYLVIGAVVGADWLIERISNVDLTWLLAISYPVNFVRMAMLYVALIAVKRLSFASLPRDERGGATIEWSSLRFVGHRLNDWVVGSINSTGRGITETVLMPHLLRALGAKIGKDCEFSNAQGYQPELLNMGNGTMVADLPLVGMPVAYNGRLRFQECKVGDGAFLGNGATYSVGAEVGPRSLIGVQCRAPEACKSDDVWLGSPPVALTAATREVHADIDITSTWEPPWYRRVERVFWNIFTKIALPGAIAEMLGWSVIKLAAMIEAHYNASTREHAAARLGLVALLGPFAAVAACVVVVIWKWLLIGKLRPGNHALWSRWMWRFELSYEIDLLLSAPLKGLIGGTPFVVWLQRAMGARVGKRVVFLGAFFEHDLIDCGDDVCFEGTAHTHLFENRVISLGPVTIGDGCTIGKGAMIIKWASIETGVTLSDASVVLAHEQLRAACSYAGNPIEVEADLTETMDLEQAIEAARHRASSAWSSIRGEKIAKMLARRSTVGSTVTNPVASL